MTDTPGNSRLAPSRLRESLPPGYRVLTDLDDPCVRLLLCGYSPLVAGRWRFHRHHEPFWRLYWNDAPGATIQCGDLTIPLDPSGVVLVSPNVACTTEATAMTHHLYLHFHSIALQQEMPTEVIVLPMEQPLEGIVKHLVDLIKASENGSWEISLAARAFISTVLTLARPAQRKSPRLDRRVLKVLSWIEDHFHTPVTNAELARLAGMNAHTLNQFFNQQVGHSLQTHIRIKRIEKASLMLQFSDESLEQIAEATGFCDRYHFTRVFRTIQKVTPAAYRQSCTPTHPPNAPLATPGPSLSQAHQPGSPTA